MRGQSRQRARLLFPRVPAGVTERLQVVALEAPRERIAGEEIRRVEQEDDAAGRVPRNGNRYEPLADRERSRAGQQLRGKRGRVAILLVNPGPRAELLDEAVRVGHVVAMREQDIAYPAHLFESCHQITGEPRRVDEEVPGAASNEVRMRSEGRPRVVAATEDPRCELMRKQAPWW